jgi:hypothetical protein
MQARSAPQPNTKADGSSSSPDSASPRVSSSSQNGEDVTLSSPQLVFASQRRSRGGGLRSFAGVQSPAILQTSLREVRANAKEKELNQAGQGTQREEGGIICYSPPSPGLLARVETLQREQESTQDALAAQTHVLHSYTQLAEVQIPRLKRQEAEAKEAVRPLIALIEPS